MNFSDEKLSAFLDHELPEAEMAIMREAIVENESLAVQIAELASADAAIQSTYSAIDKMPLSESLRTTLKIETDNNHYSGNIVQFPFWRRAAQQVIKLQNLAAAAAVAVLMIGLNTLTSEPENLPAGAAGFATIEQVLEQAPSGEKHNIGQQVVMVRASFSNQQGEYCRQFYWQQVQQTSENIACYQTENWQVVATRLTSKQESSAQYQSASTPHLLDDEIDQMISGSFYNTKQEQHLILNKWSIQ